MNTQAKDTLSKEKRKELDYSILNEASVSHKTAVGKQFIAMSVIGLGFLFYIREDLNGCIEKIMFAVSAILFLLAIFTITWFFNKVSDYFALRIDIIVEDDLAKKQILKDKSIADDTIITIISIAYKIKVCIAILLCVVLASLDIF